MAKEAPNQLAELRRVREAALTELVNESNPKNWPKGDSQQGRGDRYWTKKNAIATAELIETIDKVITMVTINTYADESDEQAQKAFERAQAETDAALEKLARNPVGEMTRNGKKLTKAEQAEWLADAIAKRKQRRKVSP